MLARIVCVGRGCRAASRPFLAVALMLAFGPRGFAQTLPPVTVGAGVQTSYTHTSTDGGEDTDAFPLNSVRLYVNGSAAKNVTFMLNTEYTSSDNNINVLDAAAQLAISPQFNVWAGRFLPPSDRANLYGPYFANHWATYTDGVQDGYPFVATGRDNGVMYWGQFDKVKVSGGAFDGQTATGDDTVLAAGRVQLDLWDPESGYYLNGTYYGEKKLLAVGLAGQVQGDDKSAWNVDFLLERKLGTAGTVSVESEYANYSKLGGYNARYASSDGAYILGAYLLPQAVGRGRVQLLGKFAKANFEKGLTSLDVNYDQKTTEFNANYIINGFNARVMLFFKNTSFNAVQPDNKQIGIGLQLQM
jgi:hypothetical protein